MTVRAKATKPTYRQVDAEEVINRGGRTVAESAPAQEATEELRFTLRIPNKIISQIDKDRSTRVGNVSRNQWILEAIADQLK